jgi:hypothetical protein
MVKNLSFFLIVDYVFPGTKITKTFSSCGGQFIAICTEMQSSKSGAEYFIHF